MLTDKELRALKPGPKPKMHYDQYGLYLEHRPNGAKWWRWRYRFGGKEKLLSLSSYPDVPLKEARLRRDEVRLLLSKGIDPAEARKAGAKVGGIGKGIVSPEVMPQPSAEGPTCREVAEDWLTRFASTRKEATVETIRGRLKKHIYPVIGDMPVADVDAPAALGVLRRVEAAGLGNTVKRVRIVIGQVMRFAVASGLAKHNPTPDIVDAIPPAKVQHHPAPTTPQAVGAILRAVEGCEGTATVRAALRLGPLVFVRPGELRQMCWEQIDLEDAVWTPPPS